MKPSVTLSVCAAALIIIHATPVSAGPKHGGKPIGGDGGPSHSHGGGLPLSNNGFQPQFQKSFPGRTLTFAVIGGARPIYHEELMRFTSEIDQSLVFLCRLGSRKLFAMSLL